MSTDSPDLTRDPAAGTGWPSTCSPPGSSPPRARSGCASALGGFATVAGIDGRQLAVVGTELVVLDGSGRRYDAADHPRRARRVRRRRARAARQLLPRTPRRPRRGAAGRRRAAAVLLPAGSPSATPPCAGSPGAVRGSRCCGPSTSTWASRVDAVNYGCSPGDDAIPEPYLYVGRTRARPGATFWNAPFGAARPPTTCATSTTRWPSSSGAAPWNAARGDERDPRSPTTPSSPTGTPPRWWTATARSTGCASPLRQARRCSPGCSTTTPGTGRCGRPATARSTGATSTARWCWRRRSRTADRHRWCSPTRWRLGPATAATGSAPTSRTLLLRAAGVHRGRVEVVVEYAPRPEYGLVVPLLAPVDGGVAARGGADRLVLVVPGGARAGAGSAARPAAPDRRRVVRFGLQRSTLGASRRPGSGPRPSSAGALDDTVGGLAVVVGAAPGLRRAVARPGPPQRPGAAGAVVPARAVPSSPRHHLAARGASAASATGTTATPGCATRASRWRRCGWPPAPTRPTTSSHFMTTAAAARSARTTRCRSCSASPASTTSPSGRSRTSRLAGQPPGAGRATAPGTRPSSTSTANCSAPPHGWSTSFRPWTTTTRAFLAACADAAAAALARHRSGDLGDARRARGTSSTRR